MRWKKKKNKQQKFTCLVAFVLQLTYAAVIDRLVQEEKLNGCHGCVIQHLSQRKHFCMMDHDVARENIDFNNVLKTANTVCSLVGFKLSNSWETYTPLCNRPSGTQPSGLFSSTQ